MGFHASRLFTTLPNISRMDYLSDLILTNQVVHYASMENDHTGTKRQ